MKSTSKHSKSMLLSLTVALCMLLAVSYTYAESDTTSSDRPQRQRQFQGEGKGLRQGQGDGEGRGAGPRGPFNEVIEQLNLTDAQKEQVKQIMTKHHEQVEAFREKNGEQFQELRGQMRDAMEEKDYDKLHSLIDQLKAVEKDRPTIKQLASEIRAVLTEEQQKIWDAKAEEIKNNRGKHMRRGPGGDGEQQGENGQRQRRRDGQQRPAQDDAE